MRAPFGSALFISKKGDSLEGNSRPPTLLERNTMNVPLTILRMAFIAVAAGIAFILDRAGGNWAQTWTPIVILVVVIVFALAIVAADMLTPAKRIDTISAVYFGLFIGVLLTYIVMVALEPMLADTANTLFSRSNVRLVIGMTLCYACVSLLLQTKDDFRFIIPYVEFTKEVKGQRPYVLDTSVVIDGRIADLVETNILDAQLIMPRFVLTELQAIADSGDKLKRARGRRGLDVLNKLRGNPKVDLKIHDRETSDMVGQPVDMKLVLLARQLEAKIVTGDFNLNKVAKLHNVTAINLNDISNALKPVFLPGEIVDVLVTKAGEEAGQGVGYLEDGTMVVIEGGRECVGRSVRTTVTSMLQTSAGRMVFGRVANDGNSR
jgi:uncharacterized protein YacL